jgi:hypothetical protein
MMDGLNSIIGHFNMPERPKPPKLLDYTKYDRQELVKLCIDFLEDEYSGDLMYILMKVCARIDFSERLNDNDDNSTRKDLIDMLQKDVSLWAYDNEFEDLKERNS